MYKNWPFFDSKSNTPLMRQAFFRQWYLKHNQYKEIFQFCLDEEKSPIFYV